MGMFDTIVLNRELPCPKCGALLPVDQWQSKDGPCELLRIRQDRLHEYMIQDFHTICLSCGKWLCLEYSIPIPDEPIPGYHWHHSSLP